MKIKTAYLGPILTMFSAVLLAVGLFFYSVMNIKAVAPNTSEKNNSDDDLKISEGFKLDNLTALGSTPVFIPMRKMPIVDDQKVPEPVAETVNFNLIGIMKIDGLQKALLKVEGENIGHWVHSGETIEGWKVNSISNEAVEVENSKKKIIEVAIQRNSQNPVQPKVLVPPKVVNIAGNDAEKQVSPKNINQNPVKQNNLNTTQTQSASGTRSIKDASGNTVVIDEKTGQAINIIPAPVQTSASAPVQTSASASGPKNTAKPLKPTQ